MPVYQLIREQKIYASVDEVWNFISSPSNLQKITPDYMRFQVTSKNLTEKMYPGMIISYKVSPILGIKMTWVTEITHVRDKEFFVDEQRVGPYKMWHHEHHIKKIRDGVLMTDIVTYQPPLSFLGAIVNSLIIKNQLTEIFDYRNKVVDELFSSRS